MYVQRSMSYRVHGETKKKLSDDDENNAAIASAVSNKHKKFIHMTVDKVEDVRNISDS